MVDRQCGTHVGLLSLHTLREPALRPMHAQGDEAVIEPYVMAREVSVTVIQSAAGPFAMLPTEIELRDPEDLVIRSQLELDVQHAATEVRGPLLALGDPMPAGVCAGMFRLRLSPLPALQQEALKQG